MADIRKPDDEVGKKILHCSVNLAVCCVASLDEFLLPTLADHHKFANTQSIANIIVT